ncbi:MAG TPA: PIN domain-containing protein [Opitutales bacterium]|jgi:predicted nucleic acid-binding protein|nr:PIN domain-containing protein [Opitutales bacterium]
MVARALVDTGFLVALVDRNDSGHAWAAALAKTLPGPWLTCEACISESYHLLGQITPAESLKILAMIERGALLSQHLLPEQLAAIQAEAVRYHGRPVDFADACLMALSDTAPRLPVVTMDKADFAVYLRGRRPRQLMTPV